MEQPFSLVKAHIRIFWRRRRRVILGWGVLTLIGIALFTFWMDPIYAASCKILVEPSTKGSSSELSALMALSSDSVLDTQIELLKSRPVVERALQTVNFLRTGNQTTGTTYERFVTNALTVARVQGTNILSVTVRDTDPLGAARLAVALAESYILDNSQNTRAGTGKTLKYIDNRLARVQEDLTAAEENLKSFKLNEGSVSLSEEARTMVQQASEIETDVQRNQVTLQEVQQRLVALRLQIGLSPREAMALTAISQDAAVQKLRSQLIEAESEPLAPGLHNPALPGLDAARARIRGLEQALTREVRRVLGTQLNAAGMAQRHLDPVRQALTQDLVRAEIDRLALEARVQAGRNLSRQLSSRLSVLPEQETQLARLVRRMEVQAEIYKMLLKKREEAKLAQETEFGNARMIEYANVPERPVAPRQALYLLLGGAAGLALGLLLALIAEYRDESIRTSEEVRSYLQQFPMLGTVAWAQVEPGAYLYSLVQPHAIAVEGLRILRTNLRSLGPDGSVHTWAITSSRCGEGRSLLLANLSVVMAQAGKSILVVDADFHNPIQHKLFAAAPFPGLREVLQGEIGFQEAVQKVGLPRLHLLASGRACANPSELLEASPLPELIRLLREEFAYILFDTPPIGLVTDASVVAASLDGLILVAGAGIATRKSVETAIELLAAAKSNVLGVVIHGCEAELSQDFAYLRADQEA